ncbi:TetR/AcrR family transcriptional regulator [Acinetobacter baumannii]|uniref:TetR/AcrR family transcriptional regulator n=1 Tax=Acinetobacter baumannii TaxID=470 RepID=UPI0038B657F5
MILNTAMNLFIQESYITVGVDQIITEANVAKATFYNHFSSKEKLVLACLKELKLDIEIGVEDCMSDHSHPLAKLYQLYMWYIDWISQSNIRGCPFHKARMDLVDVYPSILVILDEYRKWLFKRILFLFEQLKVNDPNILAHIFINILDGVIADSLYDKNPIQPQKTWNYINTLIELEKN